MRRRKIADIDEVLEMWTMIMRGSVPDTPSKVSDRSAAAEKLYRHFLQKAQDDDTKLQTGVIIIPEISADDDSAEGGADKA